MSVTTNIHVNGMWKNIKRQFIDKKEIFTVCFVTRHSADEQILLHMLREYIMIGQDTNATSAIKDSAPNICCMIILKESTQKKKISYSEGPSAKYAREY